MTNAISFLFQSWIIIYFNSCVSLEKNIQTFTCQKALSISTNAGSVTEVASRSATQCTVQCINDKLCQRASYDEVTNVCRMSHDSSINDCDVEKEAIEKSVFCMKPQVTCDIGWSMYKGICYFFGKNQVNWTDAVNECKIRRSCLVQAQDEKKHQSIVHLITERKGMNTKEIWMGANDLDKENDWVWSDKSKFSFTSWRDKSEPNNRDNNEHCGTMRAIDGWNDQLCSRLLFYMCEK